MNQRVWEARTGSMDAQLLAYSESIADDTPFVQADLAGSIAHVLGLKRAGLLDEPTADALVRGLRQLGLDHVSGAWRLRPELEDVHMNIESRLTDTLGDPGRRLHTGRSRNDQVATCIILYARSHLADLAAALESLSSALATQARAHAATPWTARTHGQRAQPSTLGFLLAAHAVRCLDHSKRALAVFDDIGESPLGCGAVAGSTLPLDPAYTAHLLGLRPPRNALLATGSRDAALAAIACAAHTGLLLASLASDLLDLFGAGAVRLPPGFTTGSSLMPQKRNPDSLELLRADGKALAADWAQAQALVAGLGLGYHRDFQRVKPILVRSIATATTATRLMRALVDGLMVVPQTPTPDAGQIATDVAEAMVASGVPFRTAYQATATAFQAVEQGADLAQALRSAPVAPAARAAALGVLEPDPARRDTVAGTSPRRVVEALDGLAAEDALVVEAVAAARKAAQAPFLLLEPEVVP